MSQLRPRQSSRRKTESQTRGDEAIGQSLSEAGGDVLTPWIPRSLTVLAGQQTKLREIDGLVFLLSGQSATSFPQEVWSL